MDPNSARGSAVHPRGVCVLWRSVGTDLPDCGGAGMNDTEVEEVVANELITKTEAIEKVTAWLEDHPGGLGWCRNAQETAELIFEEDA